MPPKKATIVSKTSRTLYALCVFEDGIGASIELAMPASSETNYIKAVLESGKLHILHEFMLATDTEIELEELEEMDLEELVDTVLTWIEENRPNYTLVSFLMSGK